MPAAAGSASTSSTAPLCRYNKDVTFSVRISLLDSLCCGLFLTGCNGELPKTEARVKPDATANGAGVSLKDVDGRSVNLADYKGKSSS